MQNRTRAKQYTLANCRHKLRARRDGNHKQYPVASIYKSTPLINDSIRFLNNLLDNFPGMVYRCQHDSNWTMDYVSKGCFDLTGYPPEALIGNAEISYESLIHPEDRLNVRKVIDTAISQHRMYQVIYRIQTMTDEIRWIREQGQGILGADGKILCLEGFLADTSESVQNEAARQRLETQVQHAQKMESLGIMAGGIAHDFNNILTGIIGHADLALSEISEEEPVRYYFKQILQSGYRAADLARQMLAYAGKGTFTKAPVNLALLVRELTPLVTVTISKKIQIIHQYADNDYLVFGDKSQLEQVIMNLLVNAAESIGDQEGEIRISIEKRFFTSEEFLHFFLNENLSDGHYISVSVSDTGCGMTPEVLARIFDPFFSTKFAGRGLGMAAVLGIIRSHQGAICVESVPGQGTRIETVIPLLRDVKKHDPIEEIDSQDWSGSGTVLIIDDEDTVRQLATELLGKLGFGVLIACDGVEGVEIYRQHYQHIHVVLLDMTMPRLDGSNTYSELRRINPDVKVILSSGFNEQDVTNRFAGKGLSGFLQKPYNLGMLRESLRSILQH